MIQTIRQQVPALVIATVLLAAVIVLGYFAKISATDTAGAITALATALGLTGIVILASTTTPNATLVSHGAIVVEMIAGIVALSLHNVFGSDQIVPLLYLFIGGGTVSVAVGVYSASKASAVSTKLDEVTAIPPTP